MPCRSWPVERIGKLGYYAVGIGVYSAVVLFRWFVAASAYARVTAFVCVITEEAGPSVWTTSHRVLGRVVPPRGRLSVQVKSAFLFFCVGQGRGCSLGARIARTGIHLCGPCCADCAERIAPLPTLCGLCSTTLVLADLPGYQPCCSGR